MAKTRVVYSSWDPTNKYVTHVAIEVQTEPPYVFKTYNLLPGEKPDIESADTIVVLPIKPARQLFEFYKGNLADLTDLVMK